MLTVYPPTTTAHHLPSRRFATPTTRPALRVRRLADRRTVTANRKAKAIALASLFDEAEGETTFVTVAPSPRLIDLHARLHLLKLDVAFYKRWETFRMRG